jgi:hypothetical protein
LVDWGETIEGFYVILVIVSLIWAFASLYPSYGLTTAGVLVIVLGFFEAIFGYILFEKVLD